MITPLDIQNKEFKKSIRGYNESQVDEFLDEIIRDYENIYKENLELKDKILLLNEQIEKYNNLENTLKETLVVAQSTADELISSAKEKAGIIMEDANVQSKRAIDEANQEIIKIRKEYESLLKEMIIFKTRYKSLIESQLTTLDDFYSEVDNNSFVVNNRRNLKDYINESEADDSELQDIETEKDIDDLGA